MGERSGEEGASGIGVSVVLGLAVVDILPNLEKSIDGKFRPRPFRQGISGNSVGFPDLDEGMQFGVEVKLFSSSIVESSVVN